VPSEPTPTSSSALARTSVLAIIVASVIAVDQLSKALITKHLVLGQSVPVIPGLLDLTLVRNTGMAFGVFSRADWQYKSLLVTVLALIAMSAVTYYAFKTPPSERWTRFGLALILGGAIGNIIDRARLGYVIDFVDVFYQDMHWPAFNVADSCISVGVGLLVLETLRRREPIMPASASGREPITHTGES
jgi:signal peptidase II